MKKNSYELNFCLIFYFLFCIASSPAVVGFESFSADTIEKKMNDLPWSEREIQYCQHLFHAKSFLHQHANLTNFKRYAPKTKIIHFATHAFISDENPLNSALLFSQSGLSSNIERLTTYDLFNMNLNANLAVLSACNTGVGKLVRGEGIVSLARGFQYAGCDNVIMSLWQVDDKTTTEIMTHFYQFLRRGLGKGEALRQAKLKYLQNAEEVKTYPFYWAGFMLVGDDEPITFSHRQVNYRWLLVTSSVVLLFALIIFIQRRQTFLGRRIILSFKKYFFVIIIFSLVVFSFLFYCHKSKPTASESESDALATAHNYISRAENYFQQAYFDTSLFYYDKASKIFLLKQDWQNYVSCLNGIANNLIKQACFDSAEKVLLNAQQFISEKLDSTNIEQAAWFNQMGSVFRFRGNFPLALFYFQKALSIMTRFHSYHESLIAEIYQNLSIVDYYLGHLDQAMMQNDSSFAIRKTLFGENHFETAKNFSLTGLISLAQGEMKKALENYQRALSIQTKTLRSSHPDIGKSFLNLGVVFYRQGDYENALNYYQKSLQILLKNSGENNLSVAGAYMNLGAVSDNRGDFEAALSYYFKAESIMNNIGLNEHVLVADLYNNIGIAYKNQRENEKALHYYQKSMELYSDTVGKNHPKVANLFLNISILYSAMKNHPQAIAHFEKALSLGRQIFEKDNPHFALTFLNMGLEFLRAENYRRALHFFNEAIRRASKTFGTRHPILSEAYQGIGQLYVQQKKYSQALAYFQRAIIALALNFDSRNIYSNPQLTNISDEVRLTNALFAKARALHDLFAMNTHNLCDLKSSVNTYELTIDLINKISNSYLSETTKFFFSDTVHSIFKQAVAAAAELYFVSQNETYKELAFVFVEKSKAALLRQVLLDKRAKQFAHIPDSLLQQENQFKIEIAFCRNQLFETLRKDKQAENVLAISWRNKLFSAERNYETLISQLKANYPNYYHLKFESDIPSVAELQRRLQTDGSTLIDYFYDEHVLYIFTVAKQNFELRKVMLDSPLDDNISGLRKCLIDRDSQKYFFFAKELYNKLIAPIKENIKDKKIIILPDGKLGYLPFETLISHYSDTTNYRAALYLLQDLQIRYAYSVTQLFENNTCEPSRKKLDFVGFAPVNFH